MGKLLDKEVMSEMRVNFIAARYDICKLEHYAENNNSLHYLNEAWNLLYEAQKEIERLNK